MSFLRKSTIRFQPIPKSFLVGIVGCIAMSISGTSYAADTASTEPRFIISTTTYAQDASKNSAADTTTGLEWRRCIEGQTWDGTICTGQPLLMTHQQAFAHAKKYPGWRLPDIKELYSLVQDDIPERLDTSIFSAPGIKSYWTSTPYVPLQQGAWSINFTSGNAFGSLRTNLLAVRLIRANR